MAEIGRLSLQVYAGDVERADNGRMKVNKDRQGNLIPSGNAMGGLLQAPIMNVFQSFPVTVENVKCLTRKFKHPIPAVNNTGLNDRLNVEDELQTPVGHKKHMF